jgi:phosphotriesterase-related protein
MIVRTVLGDIPAQDAGMTLTHEHILYAYPGADLDHRTVFDFEAAVEKIADELRCATRDYGFRTLVDMTPVEVGRHPLMMREVSRRSGMNIVAITGFFPASIGIPYYWRRQSVEELTEFFLRDLTQGMVFNGEATDIRAGMLKIATGQESVHPAPSPLGPNGRHITEHEERVIRAAGRAQRLIGCAVNTHTDPQDQTVTNPGLEQLDLLEEEGCDPRKVMIGHTFIEPDLKQMREILNRGASVGVDHIGIPWRHDNAEELDEKMARTVCELANMGYLDRIVFAYDRWFYNPRSRVTDLDPDMPNERVTMGYLFESFLPRLERAGFRRADLDTILVENPRRIMCFEDKPLAAEAAREAVALTTGD